MIFEQLWRNKRQIEQGRASEQYEGNIVHSMNMHQKNKNAPMETTKIIQLLNYFFGGST